MEREVTLDLPTGIFDKKHGFSVDFGSSLLKLVYCTDHGDTVRLHFLIYDHADVKVALALMKEKLGRHLEAGSRMYVTGVGANSIHETVEETLGVKLEVLMEHDCMVSGFQFLTDHLTQSELTFPRSDSARDFGIKVGQQLYSFINKWASVTMMKPWKPTSSEACQEVQEDEAKTKEIEGKDEVTIQEKLLEDGPKTIDFPVLLVLAGSAGGPFVVYKDGTYIAVETWTCCGKAYHGLGSLLTGAKDYQELDELATAGNAANVNHTLAQMITDPNQDEMYSSGASVDLTLFSFSRAINKQPGDFSRADLAAAIVASIAQGVVNPCVWVSMYYGIRRIFFAGSLANHSAAFREQTSQLLELRTRANPEGFSMEHYFLKHGGYLGALGALLKNVCCKSAGASQDPQ